MESWVPNTREIRVRFGEDDSLDVRERVKRVLGYASVEDHGITVDAEGVLCVHVATNADAQHSLQLAERAASLVRSDEAADDPMVDIQREVFDDGLPFVMSRFSPFEHH